ncbi:MAG: hypothetical protein DRJ10_08780 [Bacteroidetes bacterium]|nr:MAG: hypothetical protein DRJ10_08780 [Bacteroidota bacterium]
MRTILFIVLSTFIAKISMAQQDTLIIKLDDYGQITIMTDQLFSKKEKPLNFDDIYSKFYTDFKKIDKSDMQDDTFNIQYVYDEYDASVRSIKIEKGKEKSKAFYFQDSVQQAVKPFNHVLSVKVSTYPYYKMQLCVNKLNDFGKIAQLSIDSLYKKAQLDILNRDLNKRIAYKIIYTHSNDKLNVNPVLINSNKINDFISLYPSFGLSVINSNFAPEIDFNIDFILSHKAKTKYKFGINTSFLFIQDENDFFKVYTYNIASAYYHLFIRDNSSHKFSMGYMYRKTGPHFNGDTWTASWQYNLKNIGIKLGGYFTKNHQGNYVAIPSIGINFGF